MGASRWFYAVPYQEDLEAALSDLRWQVFREGKYHQGPMRRPLPSFEDWCQQMPPEWRQDVARLRRTYDEVARREAMQPSTPEEAVQKAGEDGTHSILDMTTIATEPGSGVLAPLPAETLEACFGTQYPSKTAVKARAAELVRRRGWGTYVIAYQRETPRWICFLGLSGD